MTIKPTSEGEEPQTYEVNGPVAAAWLHGCLAIVAVLALPIAALFRLIHG